MKKIFYILFFTVVLSAGGSAQSRISLSAEPSTKLIRFFPNPAVNVINFEFEKNYDRSYSFQVYNFIGKKVLDIKNISPKLNIPLDDFYRGVYIYQLRDNTGKIVESGKFQVIK